MGIEEISQLRPEEDEEEDEVKLDPGEWVTGEDEDYVYVDDGETYFEPSFGIVSWIVLILGIVAITLTALLYF